MRLLFAFATLGCENSNDVFLFPAAVFGMIVPRKDVNAMTFSENLTRIRKTRGFSQEELASRISVSRQAVSKWETGDAMPDLNNLLLLAQALEVTLEELCKGESPAEQTPSPSPAKKPWVLIVLCILLSLALVASLALLFSLPTSVKQEENSYMQALAEEFSVTGVNFSGKSNEEVSYQFVPSLSGEEFSYRIAFTDADGNTSTYPALCTDGVCTGTVEPRGLSGYTVTVTVSCKDYSKHIAIAQNLSFREGHASWTPLP